MSSKIENLNKKRLQELQKDPKNKVYEYTDADTKSQKFKPKYDPKIVIERFLLLRIEFEKCRQKRSDWTDEQCRHMVMRDHPAWDSFLESYQTFTDFIFSRKQTNATITNLLSTMKHSIDSQSKVDMSKATIAENHPHYKQIANSKNQAFVQGLFNNGLVNMSEINPQK